MNLNWNSITANWEGGGTYPSHNQEVADGIESDLSWRNATSVLCVS